MAEPQKFQIPEPIGQPGAAPELKVLERYNISANGLPVEVTIRETKDFVPRYDVTFPGIGKATKLLILSLRGELLTLVPVDPARIQDKTYIQELTKKVIAASNLLIDRHLPGTGNDVKRILIAYLTNMMLGLGDLEAPLADDKLEEIAVNGAGDEIWVFHKTIGWCKTNIKPTSEEAIYDQAESIGRRIGREINNLSPLMDAELADGSRVNATLFPVSQGGNTITIRKFEKNPWTMPAMIAINTISSEMAGLVWLCIENEIGLLISGGTASGKTSFLNAMSIFYPTSRRIVSVEETRELSLPNFFQWVPMLTRQPNPEGKGEIAMHDLMVNALRQRPDIMLVGEVRTAEDAQTLFEAIHTGHAVYSTVHADSTEGTVLRMTNPPINTPKILLNSLGGIVTAFRHRTRGIRRILEIGEVLNSGDANVVWRWELRDDSFKKTSELTRLAEMLNLYAGLTKNEIDADIAEKALILNWMVKNKVLGVDDSGFVVASYYRNKAKVLDIAKQNVPYSRDLF